MPTTLPFTFAMIVGFLGNHSSAQAQAQGHARDLALASASDKDPGHFDDDWFAEDETVDEFWPDEDSEEDETTE